MPRTKRPVTSLSPAISFSVTIEKVALSDGQQYHVWLGLIDDGDFDETPFSFVAGTFATFDAAVSACLETFPGREIQTALDPRANCPQCGGMGSKPIPGAGPHGPTRVQCAACNGEGLMRRPRTYASASSRAQKGGR